MRPDKFMPIYWGDYLKDTGHLSAAEHGAYLLLIGHYWTTGKPLPSNLETVRRIARMERDEWEASRDTVMAFFDLDGDVYRHGRIDAEMAKAIEKYEKRAAAGRAGNEKRWGNKSQCDSQCDPNALAKSSQPQPQPHSYEEENTGTTVSKETSVPAAGAAPSLFDGMGEGSIRTMPKIGAGSNVTPIRPAVETLEKRVFSRGKEVLGKSAGGMIANLRKKLEFNDEAAMRAIDAAAEKESPREWMSRFIQSGSPSEFGILRRNVPVEEMTHAEFMADLRRRREAMGCIL